MTSLFARRALLDMGTGGGERLSRLRPLGIPVVQDEGAPDNTGQTGNDRGRLPFRDGVFGLVASRHEAFRAAEVGRVLAPGAGGGGGTSCWWRPSRSR